PQLRAFLPAAWREVPALLYFHENQLTYPESEAARFPEDKAPGWTQMLSCLCAEGIAFNSAFHRDQFDGAARALLDRLPKPKPVKDWPCAMERAQVLYPGIDRAAFPVGPGPEAGAPLRIVFNHRWEYDKGPRVWLEVAREALARGADLELVLLGERSQDPGPEYGELLAELAPRTLVRGHLESRAEYARWLGACDLVVSCASHEFYGMAVLEAVCAGCTPFTPASLAYPEVLDPVPQPFPHYGSREHLLQCVLDAAKSPEAFRTEQGRRALHAGTLRHDARETHRRLDESMERLIER
ncbi:MAG: DUF3524 domain-containing protein, partial [Planctomycetes bacterium]|nr:DUF3524 domain-containing protein [Planctomycetota bacterium]